MLLPITSHRDVRLDTGAHEHRDAPLPPPALATGLP